ncbi:DUF2834 domain-containing protein [Allohahella marinimesophila]|uniref:DUF2834 domain-containing protein n=1 Tax=Allohahella marinimesophila TaxID=1054972 RepID=A0ABP7PFN2_9GAMM
MTTRTFQKLLIVLALGFALVFLAVVVPPLVERPDLIGAFAAGFVNPYASGYAMDVFFCWFVLAAWVWYEASTRQIRYGWIALVLGIVPGVATGFAVYLLMRLSQEKSSHKRSSDEHV